MRREMSGVRITYAPQGADKQVFKIRNLDRAKQVLTALIIIHDDRPKGVYGAHIRGDKIRITNFPKAAA